MSDFPKDKLEACLEGALVAGTALGVADGGTTAVATGGISVAAAGAYGCISQWYDIDDLSEDGLDAAGWFWRKAGEAAGFIGRLFSSPPPKKERKPTKFEDAVLVTMWHLEHRGTPAFEWCQPKKGAEKDPTRWESGDCLRWQPGDVSAIWNQENRAALYGPITGANTTPELLYKGLSTQYGVIKSRWPQLSPQENMAAAITSYGDFLQRYYIRGQRDETKGIISDWLPTKRLRSAQRQRDAKAEAGFVKVYNDDGILHYAKRGMLYSLPLIAGFAGAMLVVKKK